MSPLYGYGSAKPDSYTKKAASKEYLTGGFLLDSESLSVLRHDEDIITRRFGDAKIQEMMRDPEIKKCLTVLKIGILDSVPKFTPAVQKPLALRLRHDSTDGDESHGEFHCEECRKSVEQEIADYEESKKYADFLNKSIFNLDKDINVTLSSMLDGLFYGNKVAEKVYEEKYDSDLGKNLIFLKSLRVKPRDTINFVVDAYGKVVGIRGTTYVGRKPVMKTVARQKFMIFTHDEKDEDPRGTSKLEAVYNAWWLKTQVFPEYLKWLKQCAIPQLIGTLPPNTDDKTIVDVNTGEIVKDADGNSVTVGAAADMLIRLQTMRNATAMVVPHGAKVDSLTNSVSGDPFRGMIDTLNSEIEMGLLLQTLATSDSRNNTRAASQTHISVLEAYVYYLKTRIVAMLTEDFMKPLLELNFPGYAHRLVPRVSIGDSSRREWSKDATAISALQNSGYLSESQLPYTDEILGIGNTREESSLGYMRVNGREPNSVEE